MADQPTTPSGSRWEPDPEATAPTGETPVTPPEPNEQDAAELDPALASAPDGTSVDERRERLRGRAVLAGAATALVLGGGIAGFVIGHATGDDSNAFTPAGFTGQQNGGRLGDGQQPPGFGHDGDRDGDHGFGPPPGSTDGGSSGSSSNGAGTTGNPT